MPEETQAVNGYSVAKNYSVTMLHIGKVVDMAERANVSQGEIVRKAIDLLWDQFENVYLGVDNGKPS